MAASVAIQQVLPFGTASVDSPPPAQAERASRTGLRLHYSNRTENLLQSLIENLEAAKLRPGASLFDAATVVVPNRQSETYLRFGIARATGIASSLTMPCLRASAVLNLGSCASRGTWSAAQRRAKSRSSGAATNIQPSCA